MPTHIKIVSRLLREIGCSHKTSDDRIIVKSYDSVSNEEIKIYIELLNDGELIVVRVINPLGDEVSKALPENRRVFVDWMLQWNFDYNWARWKYSPITHDLEFNVTNMLRNSNLSSGQLRGAIDFATNMASMIPKMRRILHTGRVSKDSDEIRDELTEKIIALEDEMNKANSVLRAIKMKLNMTKDRLKNLNTPESDDEGI